MWDNICTLQPNDLQIVLIGLQHIKTQPKQKLLAQQLCEFCEKYTDQRINYRLNFLLNF